MHVQTLRDARGRMIGEVVTGAAGIQTLRDRSGVRLGEYDPAVDVTYDAGGRWLGEGNLLASLLVSPY